MLNKVYQHTDQSDIKILKYLHNVVKDNAYDDILVSGITNEFMERSINSQIYFDWYAHEPDIQYLDIWLSLTAYIIRHNIHIEISAYASAQ